MRIIEISIEVNTAETQIAVPARTIIRVAAFVTDFFTAFIIWLLAIGLATVLEAFGLWQGWILLAASFSFLVLPLAYFTAPYLFGGQTPGKRWAGIALEHYAGFQVSGGWALWRAILTMLFMPFSVFLLIDLLFLAIRSDKRSLRDRLSDTRVRQVRAPHWYIALAPFSAIVVFFIMIFGVIRPYWMQTYVIPASSMKPTLGNQDKIISNKFYYRLQPLRRGDIVVFYLPSAVIPPGLPPGISTVKDSFIKRVVALPEDSISIRKDVGIFINGKLASYQMPAPDMDWPPDGESYHVPAGQCFVVGDNLNESWDSRFWQDQNGNPAPGLPIKNISGRVTAIFSPSDRIKPL